MSVLAWAETRCSAMTLWDIGFLKIYSALFGMIVGAFLAPFVMDNLWWLAAALVLLSGRGAYRWFTAEARPT